VGTRDAEARNVSIRRLGSQDQTVLSLTEAVASLKDEATPPDLQLIA
jgi:threonyl-tRNA synthetase